jgi:leader peptidase (prepilin peptidase)/N-methyltransferase
MGALDLSASVVRGAGGAAGLLFGLTAARLAEVLPRRYGVRLLAPRGARRRRDAAIVVLAAALGAWLLYRLTLSGAVALAPALLEAGIDLAVASALLAAAAVDVEHMILPNELTLGGAALALASAPLRGVGLRASLVGCAVGLLLTLLPAALYKRVRGRSGMGLGDAKLTLLAGAWLGAEGALFVVFASAVQSALASLLMRALGLSFPAPPSVQAELAELRARAAAGDREARALLADDPMAADVDGDALGTMRLPLGPFLVLASLEFLVARRPIIALFLRWFAPAAAPW